MNNRVSATSDSSLKAREIEALTFICPAEAHPPAPKRARSPLRPSRTTIGVAGGVVLVGGLAWLLLLT